MNLFACMSSHTLQPAAAKKRATWLLGKSHDQSKNMEPPKTHFLGATISCILGIVLSRESTEPKNRMSQFNWDSWGVWVLSFEINVWDAMCIFWNYPKLNWLHHDNCNTCLVIMPINAEWMNEKSNSLICFILFGAKGGEQIWASAKGGRTN